ncbi:MAG: shikimate dehydrogenase [Candidatus Zapsychrus exili]|nr:shikimate dehydrogenase [Candidatus Zapsychrus exili]
MDQNKSIYGLIGYPVKHSLSPLMHNTAFNELDVDASYELFSLKEEELDSFLSSLKDDKSSIFGLNVTIPYKEKVIKYLDTLTPFAKKVMAVNTIVISSERKLIGYNTDGPGFLAHLGELGFSADNKRVVILGAGGAARAIVSVLCLMPERPESIKIFDIDKEKCSLLISDLKERIDLSIVESVQAIDDLNIELSDLLINCTPIGMKDDDPVLIEEELFHSNMLVYDLVYNPRKTKLLKLAEKVGAQTANGLGMLYYQGVLAFQHWAELDLDDTTKSKMRKALEEGSK